MYGVQTLSTIRALVLCPDLPPQKKGVRVGRVLYIALYPGHSLTKWPRYKARRSAWVQNYNIHI